MGDQVTPQTEATPEQRDACLADVGMAIAYRSAPATCRIRLDTGWTDPETGERFGPSWVAEIRIRRAADYVTIVMEVTDHAQDPSAWRELLDDEIRHAMGRR